MGLAVERALVGTAALRNARSDILNVATTLGRVEIPAVDYRL